MKISKQGNAPYSDRAVIRLQPSVRRFWGLKPVTVVVLLMLAVGLGIIGQAAGWYTPLFSNIDRLVLNPRFEVASAWQRMSLPALYLDVPFQDAQRLQAQRQQAALTGVHLATAGEVVSATVRSGDDAIPVQVRLSQGVFRPDEWRLNIDALNEQRVLGWRHVRLSAVSLNQWGLNESLHREGLLAAPIELVRLVFNGDMLGVYGVWPIPGAEWVARQGRALGGSAYFDQTLYWQELQHQRGEGLASVSVDLSDCQVAVVRALDGAPAGDADQAVTLLRALQSGERVASDVLDVDRMGTLLALVTLWQDSPLDDWTSLIFYLNPDTHRLEPVVPVDKVSAQSKELRWPVCFDDPSLQSAYVQALERVSQPEYLQSLQTELGTEFEQAQLVLVAASGGPALTWDELAVRQARLARWLEPVQMVQATWFVSQAAASGPDAAVEIDVANLQRVPVEVLGFDVGQSTFLPIDPMWIQAGEEVVVQADVGSLVLRATGNGYLRGVRLALPYASVFAAGRALDGPLEMRVVTRLWGLERRQSAPVEKVSSR